MGAREELAELRRLDELERKASGTAPAAPSMLDVAINAVPKGAANLLNTPVAIWNLAKQGAAALHPQIKEYAQPTPNYPMQAGEKLGLIDPAKNPQTAGQRIVDTAIQGAVGAAAGPGGLVRNLATGAAAGGAAQTTKEVTGSDLAAAAVGMATPFAVHGATTPSVPPMNQTKLQTLQEGQAAGFKVPPSLVKDSWLNNKLESLGGKAAIKQDANLRNQSVSDAMAARYLGAPAGTPITPGSLNTIRKEAGVPYEEASKLRPTEQTEWFPRYHQSDLVEQWKQARADATATWKSLNRNYDPSLRDKAKALEATADSIHGDIETLAKANNKPELIKALADAKVKIAKTHDVEQSLNLGDSSISAPIVGRMMDQGKPLSGEMKVIGKFQQAFPQVMREGASVPAAGVSGTDAAASALLGTAGYGAAGPVGALAALAPLVRDPARKLVLSDWYQKRLGFQPMPTEPMSDAAIRSALITNAIAARNGGQQ